MKPNQNQLQQGDVLLKRVAAIPANAQPVKTDPRGIVLAEGEATGHHHRIKAQEGLRLFKIDDLLFLENNTGKPVEVTHEEHKPFDIDCGIWQIGQVREFDYLTQMERSVID